MAAIPLLHGIPCPLDAHEQLAAEMKSLVRDGTQPEVRFDCVGKRYSRGRRGGSLRDTVPSLVRRVTGRTADATDRAGDLWAVRDVSFTVTHGEALGVIGHNGAGKSTILKLLAGVTDPTSGRISLTGRFAALIELGAGFHPDLTGRENVYLNGSILGLSRAEIDRKLDSIVDFAGLERFIDMPVKRFSSGMYARLGFAVAAHAEPEVLLIDEVLSVGDYAFQQKCLRKMEEFRRQGTVIVFVSHDMNAIVSLCSSAILMQAGQVVATGTPPDVVKAYTTVAFRVIGEEEADGIIEDQFGVVTRQLEIVGADLRDAMGRPARSFYSGDTATLVLRYRAHRDIGAPIIGMGVRDSNASTVYGTNTSQQRVDTGDIAAGEEIEVRFPLTLNLCEGSYSVNASAVPSAGGIMLNWREDLVSFQMLGDQTSSGIADLRASVQIEKSSAGIGVR